MAEVYVAKTKGIGGFEKLVAIKVIHPRFSEDDHFITMLIEEAKISVQLNHVNIAQTFDLGCIDDTYYIAMEFIEGADAYRVEKRANDRKLALPLDICCYVVAEVCNGLGYAHRKRDAEGRPLGIVHRDISPQNILISYAGEVKVVDFGIAKAAFRGGQTEVGVIKGKYYYMSPEQAWGDPVDQRTDVFSTGLLLHELLAGEMVYQEENIPALLDRVRKAHVPSVRERRAEVPEELARIIAKAVAKEPEDRFESAHAFGQELTKFLYTRNPTFTASRLAQLMGTLFPEEVKRHSQVLKLPTAEEEAAARAKEADAARSTEARASKARAQELESMSRDEFGPAAESSVIFDLEDIEDMTRNDILPFRKSKKPAGAASAPRAEDASTARSVKAPSDVWDDETLLKREGEWDESTLIEGDGSTFEAVHRMVAAARQSAEPRSSEPRSSEPQSSEPQELPADKTVAAAFAYRPAAAPAPRAPDKPKSMPPPPGRMPPRPPPPRGLPPRPSAPSAKEHPADRTVALGHSPFGPDNDRTVTSGTPFPDDDEPAEIPVARTVAMAFASEPPAELAPEKTVAFAEGVPPPPRQSGGIVGAAAKGIRLSADVDRFFDGHAAPPAGPFDPFGGVSQAGGPPPAPPGHDPFMAQPPPMAATEALGKPEPKKWLIPIVLVGVAVLLLVGLGAILAARPATTTLEIMSVPEGATVTLGGRELPGVTPITVEDVQPGQTLQVEVRLRGYEPHSEELPVEEGENRRVLLLNPVRVTLHVETTPSGAQVYVDNVLRGSAPLDIPGLTAGQRISLRSVAPGRQAVTRDLTISDERAQGVTLELPAD